MHPLQQASDADPAAHRQGCGGLLVLITVFGSAQGWCALAVLGLIRSAGACRLQALSFEVYECYCKGW